MPDEKWLTLSEAAALLTLSERSLRRRIDAGELQTRLTHGRREVLVAVEEPADRQMADTVEAMSEQGNRQLQLAAGTIGMSNRLAEVYDQQMERVHGELKRSRRWSVIGWSGAFALVLMTGIFGAAWKAQKQRADHAVRQTADIRRQMTDARRQAQEAIQAATEDAAEDRQQLTQALQSAQADHQEAILDAQEAARQKITAQTTDSPSRFNLANSEAIGGLWPEPGAANPFGQAHGHIFAAGLTPGGQGEH